MTDTTHHAIAEARQALALVEDAYREHLATVAQQAATIAGHEKAAASAGRIIADLEAINGDVTAERDRYAAALDRVRAECDRSWAAADCYGDDDEALRDLVTRIRAAIGGTSTWTCDCCGATNHDLAPPRRVDACHLCEHDRAIEELTQ